MVDTAWYSVCSLMLWRCRPIRTTGWRTGLPLMLARAHPCRHQRCPPCSLTCLPVSLALSTSSGLVCPQAHRFRASRLLHRAVLIVQLWLPRPKATGSSHSNSMHPGHSLTTCIR